jgi:class 3 adenylate cyclase/tetratricopeptide (TPR) repeat protein
MRCSKCDSDNREGRKFCAACGAPLVTTCPKCGAINQPEERFCGECGNGLAEAAGPKGVEPTPIAISAGGERRHLTVLFCDLVGSTEIAARLDPEEWRELMAGYHRAAAEAITRYGGHVAKYLGDGVMAYFGWPEAHENDAERAARAGLAILEEVSKLNQESTNPKISVRVGIDSGAVVVGAGAGKDTDVFGEPPNIAARVQNAAAPDTVLLTASTHRLVSGRFVVEELGAQELKGVADPVELYRVLRPTGVRGRLATARALTPFVGREEELRLLLRRWERAREGEGQLVLVVGEAGIGKSRLVAEFHDRIRDTPHIWMESAGEQFFENTPFHAITEMLSQWLELQNAADPDHRAERLERAVTSAGLKPAEAAPLIADLLQLPVGERYPAITLNPEQKRRRLLAALTGWVLGAAKLQPVVMVVEDLHWLDPSTLELEQLLAEQGVMVPLMLMGTARPEFHAQWPMRSHHTQITLNRLSARNVREMITLVAARNALASESVEAVIERTGGVPLFVEELTRAVLESGAAKLSAREIPVTLHDSLMSRLDRLGSAKDVLQIGSVIGGEFSYELLHAVHPTNDQKLESELRKLTDADLLYFRGIAPDATYQFKHALIRDAAYEALLKSRRKELHRLVAKTIDERFPDLKEMHPEILARHWTEAGELDPAIAEWERAGKGAEARSAYMEALESYQRGVSLVELLPESPERDVRELELRHSIHRMFNVTRGQAAPETKGALKLAATLAERMRALTRIIGFINAQGFQSYFSGDLPAASALADQGLELAIRDGSPMLIAQMRFLQIASGYLLGDLAGVEKNFAQGRSVFRDPDFRAWPGGPVANFYCAAICAWTAGHSNVARERERQMLEVVKANNAYNMAFSSMYGASLRLEMGECEQAEYLAEGALKIAEQHKLAYPAAFARCVRGHALTLLGRPPEGISSLGQGIAGLRDIGQPTRVGFYTAVIAKAEAQAGRIGDALETIEKAFQSRPDICVFRPELFRIRGNLRLLAARKELAEADFREATMLARGMGAKAWELRATTSLARLIASQGRREEARTMLAEIYNWFTEGFDTADLKDAKALLEQLNK